MKITAIRVYQVDLPLEQPYWLSGGRLKFEQLDSTLVAIETDEGLTGWGEGCPWGSSYLPAFARGICAGIEELAPHLLGQDPRDLQRINRIMDKALPGHPYIKSPIDVACWDILGKASGLPLFTLLGGCEEGPIKLHSSVSTGRPEEMVETCARYREKGYKIHSCKVGGSDPALDIARIEAISESLPQGEAATFDVNRAWLPGTAIHVMNQTRDPGAVFEQPCETYEECLQVRRMTKQPIALDETIKDFSDLLRAQKDSACEIIGLKIGRVGGLTKARFLRDFCLATGIRMNIEETGGSIIADTAAVHLAQSTPEAFRRATWLCHEMLIPDLAQGGARNEGGFTRAPAGPGLGLEPDLSLLGVPLASYL